MEIRVVGVVPVSSFGHDAVSDFRQPSVEHSAAFAEDVRRAAGEDVRESGQPLRVPGKRLPNEEQLGVKRLGQRLATYHSMVDDYGGGELFVVDTLQILEPARHAHSFVSNRPNSEVVGACFCGQGLEGREAAGFTRQ